MVATLVLSGVVYFTPYIIKNNTVIIQPSPYSVVVNNNIITVSSKE